MDDKFKIRLRVVEDELVNWDEFLAEFNQRLLDKEFPIVIKIDEAPDLTCIQPVLSTMTFLKWVESFQLNNDIFIETDNLVQRFLPISHIKNFNELPFFHFKNHEVKQKNLHKNFMCFVGAHRWPRFILSKFLYENYSHCSYLTYWQNKFPAKSFKKKLPIDEVTSFKKKLPLYINSDETIERHATGYINFTDTNPLLKFYQNSFIDIVCETWHDGQTFMPTEKTARPLSTMTPFIVYGPKNYLSNLKKLGFKTFSEFWSEEYDSLAGEDRIEQIKIIISTLGKLSKDEMFEMYQKMLTILSHNKERYETITKQNIMKAFDEYL